MPGLDRSGPMGAGPMTGGRRGLCGRPEAVNAPLGRGGGFGYGRGAGRGYGPGWCGRPGFGWRTRGYGAAQPADVQLSPEEQAAMLKADADALRRSLDAIQKRIDQLSPPEASD